MVQSTSKGDSDLYQELLSSYNMLGNICLSPVIDGLMQWRSNIMEVPETEASTGTNANSSSLIDRIGNRTRGATQGVLLFMNTDHESNPTFAERKQVNDYKFTAVLLVTVIYHSYLPHVEHIGFPFL
jgi:hypothetical protein